MRALASRISVPGAGITYLADGIYVVPASMASPIDARLRGPSIRYGTWRVSGRAGAPPTSSGSFGIVDPQLHTRASLHGAPGRQLRVLRPQRAHGALRATGVDPD